MAIEVDCNISVEAFVGPLALNYLKNYQPLAHFSSNSRCAKEVAPLGGI
jgi:hypothetical protein